MSGINTRTWRYCVIFNSRVRFLMALEKNKVVITGIIRVNVSSVIIVAAHVLRGKINIRKGYATKQEVSPF